MLLSSERPFSWEPLLFAYQGPRCYAAMVWRWQSCRSRNGTWQTDNRGSPGTWENPVRSSANPGPEIPGHQLQALAAHSSGRERNERVEPRYRQAKETKRGGMAAGRHSALIVPTKLANSARLEPIEGSEASSHGTVFEKHDECLEIRQSCPRNRNG